MDHDELILRALQCRISPQEELKLRAWREEDPQNEARYQAFASVWRMTGERAEAINTEPPEVASITSRSPPRLRSAGPLKRRLLQFAGLAAAFVVGLGIAYAPGDGGPADGKPDEIVTGASETATTRLSDGTVIRLAPESRLVLPSAADARRVMLDGQAFFAVAKDPERPFLVQTPSGEAHVLGTRFELDAQRGHLRLLVVEGQVAISSGASRVDVRAGQLAQVRENEAPSKVEVDDVWPLLDWMGRFLAFESTPLREVQHELETRFDLTLEFEDPSLAEETVTVWFRDEPIPEVVAVLCRLVDTRCAMEDSIVRMSRRR